MHSLSVVIAAAVLASSVRGTALSSVKTSVTLLFQNNLNYTDDTNHLSALLLDELDYSDAEKACAALGEKLLPLSTVQKHVDDIVPELGYLTYQKRCGASQAFWIDGSSISLKGTSSLSYNPKASQRTKLPALCTQSSSGTTDNNSGATTSNEISVSSNSNTFIGYRNLKSFRFLGIPYANPTPRWTYSTEYSAKKQTINATAFGPLCYQQYSTGPFSEQCQYLNIFTPYVPGSGEGSTKLKPVLFCKYRIHGGAYTSGTGADPTVDGGNMASRGDIVVVTINYRLATLGFLSIPGTSITGNYGLADQITALEWVRDNIAAFGGDKDQITIGGQSAGATSVRALLGSPQAKGKFAAALPGSNLVGLDYAATYSNYYTPAQEMSVVGNSIVSGAGCNSTSLSAVVTCLKNYPAMNYTTLPTARFVTVDGKYITADQIQITKPTQIAHVPTLWGSMAEDAGAFIGYPTADMNASTAISSLNQLPANLTEKIISSGLFPIPNTGNYTLDLYNVSARIATDIQFRCLDQATVYSGIKHNSFASAYYYQFDRAYQTPGYDPNKPVCDAPITPSHPNGDPSLPYFRCHSGDLYYEFGTLGQFDYPYRDANDLVFSQLIQDYWTSFVRTHNPNPDPGYLAARGYTNTIKQTALAGYWSPVTTSSQTLKVLSIPSHQSDFVDLKQCALLGQPLTYYETLRF